MSTVAAMTRLVIVGILPLVVGGNAIKQKLRGGGEELKENHASSAFRRGLKDGEDCNNGGWYRKLTRGSGGDDDDCDQDGDLDNDGGINGGSPVTDLDGLLYAGCSGSIAENRYDVFTTDNVLTVNVCYDICSLENSLYMAVLQGTVCRCGNDPDFLTSDVYTGTCDVGCGGDATQRCGGASACDLYELEQHDGGGDDDGDDDDDSTCSNGFPGVQSGNSCCVAECGMCGGTGCSTRVFGLGALDCCATEIEDSGVLCEVAGTAPCFIDDGEDDDVGDDGVGDDEAGDDDAGDDGGDDGADDGENDDSDGATCSNGFPGVQSGSSCCVAECGTCGGTGCSTRVAGLGASDCCETEIEDSGVLCEDAGMAPCSIDDGDDDDVGDDGVGDDGVDDSGNDDSDDSTCSNGLPGVQSGSSCCVAECGTCGGTGCSTRVDGLGTSDCCETEIEDSGVLCEDVGMAPCLIGDGTYDGGD